MSCIPASAFSQTKPVEDGVLAALWKWSFRDSSKNNSIKIPISERLQAVLDFMSDLAHSKTSNRKCSVSHLKLSTIHCEDHLQLLWVSNQARAFVYLSSNDVRKGDIGFGVSSNQIFVARERILCSDPGGLELPKDNRTENSLDHENIARLSYEVVGHALSADLATNTVKTIRVFENYDDWLESTDCSSSIHLHPLDLVGTKHRWTRDSTPTKC